jgi:hypothetical protein
MSGGTTERDVRKLALAAIRRQHAAIPVRFIDAVAPPVDDGRYVTLLVMADGAAVEALVLTTENFYESLAKVMAVALPSLGRVVTS